MVKKVGGTDFSTIDSQSCGRTAKQSHYSYFAKKE